jgi:2-succinyl-5-enolpyruvyl-6-hydroxy-3-cyclohexene-1-carboxylate synthase
MQTTNVEHIEHLVANCAAAGIKNVVISPGSRNAPLIIAFDAHPEIKTYLIHDERSAAFFAMGLAEATETPVAICCTSGSAVLNYAPAISEAYYRGIPLLVLTADRPVELVDQGDGQTIRQKDVYHNYIKAEFELPNHDDKNLLKNSNEVVFAALESLVNLPYGPVHINIPLNEPLYGLKNVEKIKTMVPAKKTVGNLSPKDKKTIADAWKKSKRKMILIGQMRGAFRPSASLKKILNDPSVVVLTENTSNLDDANTIACIDRTLGGMPATDQSGFAPDLLISIGGAIISKRIKTFLRQYQPAVHWRVGIFHFEENSFDAPTHHFETSEEIFFQFLLEQDLGDDAFAKRWDKLNQNTTVSHKASLSKITFCDLKAFEFTLKALPTGTNLHMGNSSVVRYCQLFDPKPGVRYYSNRGVSGIDGSSSTALGFANGNKNLNVLISGDISFFYDSNVFWNSYLVPNLRIIVINNGGGGIFRYIPGPDETPQLKYFVAPHDGNIQKICAAFEIQYLRADSLESLELALPKLLTDKPITQPIVLEIDTHNSDNEVILKEFFANLSGELH